MTGNRFDRAYGSLVRRAAQNIRDHGVLDLVTQAEAAEGGFNLKTLTRDAQACAQRG